MWKIRPSDIRSCLANHSVFTLFDLDGWSVYVIPLPGGHVVRVFLSYLGLVHESFSLLTGSPESMRSSCFIINAFALQRHMFVKRGSHIDRHSFW